MIVLVLILILITLLGGWPIVGIIIGVIAAIAVLCGIGYLFFSILSGLGETLNSSWTQPKNAQPDSLEKVISRP